MRTTKESMFIRREVVNISDEQRAWLDRFVERERRTRGVKCSRADAIRMILAERITQEGTAANVEE